MNDSLTKRAIFLIALMIFLFPVALVFLVKWSLFLFRYFEVT